MSFKALLGFWSGILLGPSVPKEKQRQRQRGGGISKSSSFTYFPSHCEAADCNIAQSHDESKKRIPVFVFLAAGIEKVQSLKGKVKAILLAEVQHSHSGGRQVEGDWLRDKQK